MPPEHTEPRAQEHAHPILAAARHATHLLADFRDDFVLGYIVNWEDVTARQRMEAEQSRLTMGLSPANLLGLATGHGGLDPGLRRDLEAVLVAGTAAIAVWAWRSRDWAAGAAWAAVLLVLTLGWVMPWYVLWILPFAALTHRGAPRAAAIVLTVFLLVAWAPSTAPALHRMGAHVTATATGRVNNRFMHALLR